MMFDMLFDGRSWSSPMFEMLRQHDSLIHEPFQTMAMRDIWEPFWETDGGPVENIQRQLIEDINPNVLLKY